MFVLEIVPLQSSMPNFWIKMWPGIPSAQCQTTTLHGWIGRDLKFHHKKVQKSKSAVVQGLEGISTSTVTGGPGGPGGPGEGLRVGLRLGSLELRRQGLGGLFKYGGHKTRESRLENGSKWNKIWIVHGKYD